MANRGFAQLMVGLQFFLISLWFFCRLSMVFQPRTWRNLKQSQADLLGGEEAFAKAGALELWWELGDPLGERIGELPSGYD